MEINELFASLQGEISVGKFAYFIRLSGCNLNCGFCDTKYAKQSGTYISYNDIYQQAKCFDRVVITGGEPFLQKEEVAKLVQRLVKNNKDIVIEVESNGTIKPIGLKDINNVIYNVSLKLSSSKNKYEDRMILPAINYFIQHNANFKFVICNEDDLDEVSLLINKFCLDKKNIYLMPEGATRKEQMEKMEWIASTCTLLGVNMSPRLHVLIWDNKRGV